MHDLRSLHTKVDRRKRPNWRLTDQPVPESPPELFSVNIVWGTNVNLQPFCTLNPREVWAEEEYTDEVIEMAYCRALLCQGVALVPCEVWTVEMLWCVLSKANRSEGCV